MNAQLATRLGLDRETLRLMEDEIGSDFPFEADPETIAEFYLFIRDERLSLDHPAAVAWWDDHGPQITTSDRTRGG